MYYDEEADCAVIGNSEGVFFGTSQLIFFRMIVSVNKLESYKPCIAYYDSS